MTRNIGLSAADFLPHLEANLAEQLSAVDLKKIARYLTLLAKWNRTYSLTAITEPREMVIRHIVDSLSIADMLTGNRIIDVGTGPGLPGIPLSIVHPEKQFTVLDSSNKKIQFLVHVKAMLKLDNVNIVHSRVEKYFPEQCFDVVITRAFSAVPEMLQLTQHLCCPDGLFLAMRGAYTPEESAVLPPGFVVKFAKPLQVKGLSAERHVVGIKLK